MELIKHSDTLKLAEGKIITRGWPRGMIQRYLDEGLSLSDVINKLDRAGVCMGKSTRHNLITTAGKLMTIQFFTNDLYGVLQYFAIGTGSTPPAISDVSLVTEVYRKLFTEIVAVGNTQVVAKTFILAADCDSNIKECGLFGGHSVGSNPNTGLLFSRYLEDYDNTAGLQDLTFEYTFSFT